jgi:hypothetical protein
MPSSNRFFASFIVAGLILWGAGMIALFFYVQLIVSFSAFDPERPCAQLPK